MADLKEFLPPRSRGSFVSSLVLPAADDRWTTESRLPVVRVSPSVLNFPLYGVLLRRGNQVQLRVL